MKFINGVPSFDIGDERPLSKLLHVDFVNQSLELAFKNRVCINCRYYSRGDNSEVDDKCYIFGSIHDDGTYTDPKIFSCNAWKG